MMFQLYEEMLVLLKDTLTAIDKAYEHGKIADGESEEKIKKYTGVTDKDIERIKKIIEAQGEH